MILAADAAIGVAVVGLIALAPWVCARLDLRRATALGVPLVLLLPLVVVAGPRPGSAPFESQTLFLVALLAFAIGSALLVAAAEGDGGWGSGGGPGDSPEPPWWPDFERDFRRYAGRRVRV